MIEGYLSDITERVLTEDDARRIADENDRIFNYSIGLNVVANFDGYFVKVNPAWEKFLGWTVHEMTSKKFSEFVHPEDLQKPKKYFNIFLRVTSCSLLKTGTSVRMDRTVGYYGHHLRTSSAAWSTRLPLTLPTERNLKTT